MKHSHQIPLIEPLYPDSEPAVQIHNLSHDPIRSPYPVCQIHVRNGSYSMDVSLPRDHDESSQRPSSDIHHHLSSWQSMPEDDVRFFFFFSIRMNELKACDICCFFSREDRYGNPDEEIRERNSLTEPCMLIEAYVTEILTRSCLTVPVTSELPTSHKFILPAYTTIGHGIHFLGE